MIEIRFHGRGGQGAVTSAEMIALAAINEGKYAQAFPSFGPERRGAPVMAFARVDDKQIRDRSKIYSPDVVVVLDPSLLKIMDPTEGIHSDGVLVLNSNKTPDAIREEFGYKVKIILVDADKIAREELGIPITNTTMLGALLKATGVVELESLVVPLETRFGRIAAKNISALKRAFKESNLNPAN
jgi:pyruvate ferredoxin oxidoreductase gamma subunit